MSTAIRDSLLVVSGLSVRRGEVLAVDRVDLQVEAGTFFVLVGASGCGKTSLLRAIAGFEVPLAGEVTLADQKLSGAGSWVPPERRQIGMVFQDGALFPHLTVRRNVEYGLDGTVQARGRAVEMLEMVGLGDCCERYPDELSGGERQRVAVARALAPEPRLLLLDEPFANLDAGLREHVRTEVRGIIEQTGTTAILVTHDQEEALSLADRLAVMAAGRILQQGAPEDVYRAPKSMAVAGFLSGGQLLRAEVDGGRARCALGAVDCGLDNGPARVLVRPEQIRLVDPEGHPTAGSILERYFYGHDAIVAVELESGERIEVRLTAGETTPPGDRVGVELRPESFSVFPDPAAGVSGSESRTT